MCLWVCVLSLDLSSLSHSVCSNVKCAPRASALHYPRVMKRSCAGKTSLKSSKLGGLMAKRSHPAGTTGSTGVRSCTCMSTRRSKVNTVPLYLLLSQCSPTGCVNHVLLCVCVSERECGVWESGTHSCFLGSRVSRTLSCVMELPIKVTAKVSGCDSEMLRVQCVVWHVCESKCTASTQVRGTHSTGCDSPQQESARFLLME